MKRRECSLCGGKLSKGICTECGMNNNKNDSKYHLNVDYDDVKPVKPVFKKPISTEYPVYKAPVYEPHPKANRKKKTATPSSKIIKYVVIGYLVIQFLLPLLIALVSGIIGGTSSLIRIFTSSGSSTTANVSSIITEVVIGYEECDFDNIDYDDYIYQFATTGEEASVTLTSGTYEVGVHLPEGIYDMTCETGGSIYVIDEANSFRIYEYLTSDYEGANFEDLRLSNGTTLEIDDAVITLSTPDANLDSMYAVENPNSEIFTLTTNDIIGANIPAGIYDISVSEDVYGVLELTFPYNDSKESHYLANVSWDREKGIDRSTVKNVVLMKGSTISFDFDKEEGATIILTPSEVISEMDYALLYE